MPLGILYLNFPPAYHVSFIISYAFVRLFIKASPFLRIKQAFRFGYLRIEDVERCKQSDMLEEMLREMAGEFPALSEIFVHERDEFMSFGLKRLLTQAVAQRQELLKSDQLVDGKSSDLLPRLSSSSNLNHYFLDVPSEPIVVVGVVGIGHVPGILANWPKDATNIRALMTFVIRTE